MIMGATYKKDVKDLRKSPSLKLIEILQAKKCKVDYYDPIIPYLKIGNLDLTSVEFSKNVIASYDCIVIATDHTKVDYKSLLKYAKFIYDVRNVYKNTKSKKVIKF